MDWLRAIIGSRLLQGVLIGIVASSIFFLILARYEVKEFKALGFHIVFRPSSSPQITSLTTKFQNANQALADKEKKLQSLQKKNDSYRSEILSVKQELDALTTKNSGKIAQIEKLKKQVNSLKQKTSAADKASKHLAAAEQKFKKELKERLLEMRDMQTIIDEKTKQIEKLNDVREQQKSQIGTLREEEAALRNQISALDQSQSKPSVASGEQADSQCGKRDPENEGEHILKLNKTLRLFSNTLRLRINKITVLSRYSFVSFRSNIDSIEKKRKYRLRDFFEVQYLGCTYDITISKISSSGDGVHLRVNKK